MEEELSTVGMKAKAGCRTPGHCPIRDEETGGTRARFLQV